MSTYAQPQRSRLRRNRNARPVAIDTRRHRIYYRATQVARSAPCEKRPPLEVGMRVAILEERNEFTRKVPKATFYAARVTNVGDGDNPLVTFEYENHPYATSLGAGMNHIAQFCIVLPKEGDMIGKVNIKPAAPAPAAPLDNALLAADKATIARLSAELERYKRERQEQIDVLTAVGPFKCRNGKPHQRFDDCLYCELEQVKAERDRMRDALRRLRDNGAEYCECDHSDDNCCNKVGEHCAWCICEAALGEKGK